MSQSTPILSSQALGTLDQCRAPSSLSEISRDLQTRPLTGDCPSTGSEASEENRALVSKRSSRRNTEAKQEPRGQRPHPEADSPEDSIDPEETVSGPAPPLILTLPAFESLWPPCEQGRDSGLCGSPQWWLRGDTGLLPQASARRWALHCVVSPSQLRLDELSWTSWATSGLKYHLPPEAGRRALSTTDITAVPHGPTPLA